MRTMVIAVSVGALLLLSAGCGGSSSDEADSTVTIETDASAADTAGDTDTNEDTETTGIDTTDDVSLEGCTKLTELSVKFSEALGSATTGSGAPDLEATAKAYEEFADQVPEEIRDAFKTVAAAFATYAEVLGDIDLSSGETPDPETLQKLAEAAEKLDNSELTAASAEIEAWAKRNCSG